MSAQSGARATALLRLLRISLLPTALADVFAGLLVGARGVLPPAGTTLSLVGASLLVYHGGLALNDWADRRADALTRPDRPLPSGAIPARLVPPAVALAFALAIALAARVAPLLGAWVALLAACAATYDLVGRGPRLGPFLLASCRALNLGLGILATELLGAAPHPAVWLLPVLYGAYVFVVSRLGRLEDGEDRDLAGGRPGRLLRAAAVLLVLPAFVPLPGVALPDRALALCALLVGAAGLWRRSLSPEPWTPGRVGASMGLALRRLLLFSAALALLGSSPQARLVAAALLGLGYPFARLLARRFPPS